MCDHIQIDEKLSEMKELLAARGLTPGSIDNYDNAVNDLKTVGKDLGEITAKDLIALEKRMRERLSPFTVKSRKVLLKSFLQYALIGPDATDGEYPECVNHAWRNAKNHKPHGGDAAKNVPEVTKGRVHKKDLKEMLKVISLPAFGEAALVDRNRAFFAFLWDSGGRRSEVLNVKLCDVAIDGDQGLVKFVGKTGTRKDIPVGFCIPYMDIWIKNHPFRDNPETPLFCTGKGTAMKRSAIAVKLDRIKEILIKQGYVLEDNITVHSFRHGRAQYMKTNEKASDEQMRTFFGWSKGSAMPSRYGGAAEIVEAHADHWGIKTTTSIKGELPREICSKCQRPNPIGAGFCSWCGVPLTLEAAAERAKEHEQIEKKLEGGFEQIEERMDAKLAEQSTKYEEQSQVIAKLQADMEVLEYEKRDVFWFSQKMTDLAVAGTLTKETALAVAAAFNRPEEVSPHPKEEALKCVEKYTQHPPPWYSATQNYDKAKRLRDQWKRLPLVTKEAAVYAGENLGLSEQEALEYFDHWGRDKVNSELIGSTVLTEEVALEAAKRYGQPEKNALEILKSRRRWRAEMLEAYLRGKGVEAQWFQGILPIFGDLVQDVADLHAMVKIEDDHAYAPAWLEVDPIDGQSLRDSEGKVDRTRVEKVLDRISQWS